MLYTRLSNVHFNILDLQLNVFDNDLKSLRPQPCLTNIKWSMPFLWSVYYLSLTSLSILHVIIYRYIPLSLCIHIQITYEHTHTHTRARANRRVCASNGHVVKTPEMGRPCGRPSPQIESTYGKYIHIFLTLAIHSYPSYIGLHSFIFTWIPPRRHHNTHKRDKSKTFFRV